MQPIGDSQEEARILPLVEHFPRLRVDMQCPLLEADFELGWRGTVNLSRFVLYVQAREPFHGNGLIPTVQRSQFSRVLVIRKIGIPSIQWPNSPRPDGRCAKDRAIEIAALLPQP